MAAKAVDWVAIEAEYRGTKTPLRRLADQYGVTEGAIRARAKKGGWTRDAVGLKRSLVANAMSGISQGVTQDELRNCIESEAKTDIDDMQTGLDIARNCLRNLLIVSTDCEDPRVIKTIIESNKLAIETIRKIRGLDAPMDFSNMSDEEVAALARGMAPK